MKAKSKPAKTQIKKKMTKKKIRRNVSVRQKLAKNVRVTKHGNFVQEPVPSSVVQHVAQSTTVSEAKLQTENRLCFSRLRAKVAGTLCAQTNQKQPAQEHKLTSITRPENGQALIKSNTRDVFDKEKLKNLLKVVSQNVSLKSGETSAKVGPIKEKIIRSGVINHSRIHSAEDTKGRKRKLKDQVDKSDTDKIGFKLKKVEAINEAGGSSGVDVNRLKKLLSEVSQCQGSNSPADEPLKKTSRTGKSSTVPLRERMVERLNAARFRYINQHLYSITGSDAKNFFIGERDAFHLYHQGYKNQVQKWPINPIDMIIKDILEGPPSLEIADFGCGDAKLATSVPNTVHSFDLIALNEHVIECDISKVPLNSQSVDIVVCCLSLMGTNLVDYLKEANRILKHDGQLKVAEIESRITNVKAFIRALKALGFSLVKQNTSHKMFIFLDCIKKKSCPGNKRVDITLQPCLYKKR